MNVAGKAAAGTSAGASAAGSGAAGTPASLQQIPCTASVGSCPARSIGIWKTLLDASAFGADARFVAMGGQGLLVRVGDASFKVARLRDASSDASAPTHSAWDFPVPAGATPLAITEGRVSDVAPPPPSQLVVLTCDAAHADCSVWSSELTQGSLGAWTEHELPAGLEPRGVAFDRGLDPREVCVYGNGLVCWKDSWHMAIPPAAGLSIRAVAFDAQWSLAVGDHGRWFKRERKESGELTDWQEQPVLGDAALARVSVAGPGGVIVGPMGLEAAIGVQAASYDCNPSQEIVAFLLDPNLRGLGYAITNTGKIYQHAMITPQRAEAYCDYQQLPLVGPVLEATAVPCEQALNPRVLTDHAVFGTSLCLST